MFELRLFMTLPYETEIYITSRAISMFHRKLLMILRIFQIYPARWSLFLLGLSNSVIAPDLFIFILKRPKVQASTSPLQRLRPSSAFDMENAGCCGTFLSAV